MSTDQSAQGVSTEDALAYAGRLDDLCNAEWVLKRLTDGANALRTLVSERDALAVRVRELEGDAKRWGQVRQHWKKANFSWHKTPANNIKSVTLVIDFDHLSPNGAAMIEREFDAALTTTSGDSHE